LHRDGLLTLAAAADVWRRRGGIGADPRNMNQALDSRRAGQLRQSAGGRDMDRLERLLSMLDVQTDGIHDRLRAGHRRSHRSLVVNVRPDGFGVRAAAEQVARPLRMP
jgi:hypothetical protein